MVPFTVQGLTDMVGRMLPEPHASLLSGLLFGGTTTLPHDLRDALVRSGTIHIAALSGQNLSILGRLLTMGLERWIGKRVAASATLMLILLFVWFVGPGPSIVRAAIMAGLSLIAILTGRQYLSIGAWVIAVVSMLIVTPAWIVDLSFQLSALATLGIILFGSTSDTWGSRNPGFGSVAHMVKNDLRITLAAQSLTIPLILFSFHRLSLISPLTNLAIGWIIGPLTGIGWVTVLVGWAWEPMGQPVAWIDWLLLEYLIRTVQIMSAIPFASVGY